MPRTAAYTSSADLPSLTSSSLPPAAAVTPGVSAHLDRVLPDADAGGTAVRPPPPPPLIGLRVLGPGEESPGAAEAGEGTAVAGCPLWGRRGRVPVREIEPPEPCPLTDRFDANTETVEAVTALGYHLQYRTLDALSGPAWSQKAGVIRLFYRSGSRMADLNRLFALVRAHFGIGYTSGAGGSAAAALPHPQAW